MKYSMVSDPVLQDSSQTRAIQLFILIYSFNLRKIPKIKDVKKKEIAELFQYNLFYFT